VNSVFQDPGALEISHVGVSHRNRSSRALARLSGRLVLCRGFIRSDSDMDTLCTDKQFCLCGNYCATKHKLLPIIPTPCKNVPWPHFYIQWTHFCTQACGIPTEASIKEWNWFVL